MFKKLSLSILSLCVASICLANTQAYIHTNRNEAKITNGSNAFNKNDLAPATGLVIESEEGQRVSLVLSNKVVVDIIGKARVFIEEATQDTPIEYDKAEIYELKVSNTKVNVEYGKVYFSLPMLRPTSSFKVSTPVGTYTLTCRYFRLESENNIDKVLIYEGDATFFDSKNYAKLNESQLSTIDKSKARFRATARRASLEPLDSLQKQFKDCGVIYEGTHFNTENGIEAKRVLPKKALVEDLENNHYKH